MPEQFKKRSERRQSRIRKTRPPAGYCPAIGNRICEILQTSCRSLDSIAESEDGMPNVRTLYRWLDQDAGFRRQYTLARQTQVHNLLDDCLEIADDDAGDLTERETADGQPYWVPNPVHLARAKQRISWRMQLLTGLSPKKYYDCTGPTHADTVHDDPK